MYKLVLFSYQNQQPRDITFKCYWADYEIVHPMSSMNPVSEIHNMYFNTEAVFGDISTEKTTHIIQDNMVLVDLLFVKYSIFFADLYL